MFDSSFGHIFKVHTFGESHGPGVGVVIDGCPAGLEVDTTEIQNQLWRRRPGQSSISTQRKEPDEFKILSGIYENKTLGSPLCFYIENQDVRSKDYGEWGHIYRPSHADYTSHIKYGHRTPLGGGRSSVRESVGRVIGGAIAGQILKNELGIETLAWVDAISNIRANLYKTPPINKKDVDASPVRCPDSEVATKMFEYIEDIRKAGDSVGGVIGLVCWNVPPGLGDPVFSKLEAELARAMLSIPACKGFESGSGFEGTLLRGSKHNDSFYNPLNETTEEKEQDKIMSQKEYSNAYTVPLLKTKSNHSGGIQGGISNGMPILCKLAFKPTATIFHEQESINTKGEREMLKAKGRHDPCVLPRAVPIVEAMANLVLINAYLIQRARNPEWYERFRIHKPKN